MRRIAIANPRAKIRASVMARKICVVTGTRAEYGLLYWTLKEIKKDPALELQLIVTGMHLSPEYGSTYKVIETDGFSINEKIDMLLSSDSAIGITKSLGIATIGFADSFARLKPDIVLFVGDRFEILACAQAALIANIPMAHVHGGEASEGAIDEAIRHSLTKMSHIHFVAAEEYRKRVIQLGEDPSRVFTVGALALDNIFKESLLTQNELEQNLEFKFGPKNFLVTFHPESLGSENSESSLLNLLSALDAFPETKIIFTLPNAETHTKSFIRAISAYANKDKDRCFVTASLGRMRYLSTMNVVDLVLGNSSSGIIEAPALRKPTVNIGERQRGRLRSKSVVDCNTSTSSIVSAIQKALSPEFKGVLDTLEPIYGETGASLRIKEILSRIKLEGILMKRFFNLTDQIS
jgi:UDP-hydrolysing UDP-N-acetyl-D-glucosamine 2-epimerase